MKNNMKFSELFRKYRLKSGISTLKEFGEELSKYGYKFEESVFSKWQNGSREPRDRELLIKICKIFYENKGISSTDEINEIFKSLDLSLLTKDEIINNFSSFLNPVNLNISQMYISDLDLEKTYLSQLKERKIDHKFSYMGDGAKFFYESFDFKVGHFNYNSISSKYFPVSVSEKEKILIISLCCGNSNSEKAILEDLSKNYKNITYIGVDSSRSMLDMSYHNVSNINILKYYIYADITSPTFKIDISDISKNYDRRIFLLFGNTFGNFNTNLITSTVYNLMMKDDLIWFDYNLFDKELEHYIFTYKKIIENPLTSKHLLIELEKIGIDGSLGKLTLDVIDQTELTGAYIFVVFFEFFKNYEISYRDFVFKFLKGEKINLFETKVFDRNKFVEYLTSNGFDLIKDFYDNRKYFGGIYKKL